MSWDRIRRLSAGVAGAALLIAVVTAFARVAGFGRTVVFSQTVGTNCLSTAYVTANQVPNVLFEVVIGGALSGMVVPVLAAAAERGDREHVRRTASALVTWVLLAAVPLALVLAAVATPAMTLMLGHPRGCDHDAVLALTVRFLLVFAPQIVFYGLAAVFYGILQAHRRFLAPALAPLLSSLVVITAYLAFVPLGAAYRDDIAGLPAAAELTLSLGTTAGVVALFLTALVPLLRLRLGLRPTLRFPPGVARTARSLGLAALLPLIAMQLSMLVAIMLANRGGGAGAAALYNYAWALFTLPYGVVAVPIATSAFTTLSVRHAEGDQEGYNAILSVGARATLVITAGLATALAAAARPVAEVFAPGEPAPLELALLTYAPGIVGFGLVALLSRALYAAHHGRSAAAAQVMGWLVVSTAGAALVLVAPERGAVAALGAGTSLGLSLTAVLLAVAVARVNGRAAFAGLGRGLPAALLGAGVGYLAGASLTGALDADGLWGNVGVAALGGVAALAGFGAVAMLIDRRAVRAAITRRVAPPGKESPDTQDTGDEKA
ncbi:murein biosynthesis integral membrane protein MurJ [Marinactinospora thermotolerans]|uniref:Putative peptidoglycan lipid II flippase n=1 Tax=Marinactinospora thermotolerans DSM 45154 TaxID=1122192 RepID=A0A1T4S252_9ACTN|nr:lipid II flippase MurJ [Marinactinospora thermotolerans]SKA22008.1 putative peptidoglycan lipid II flippase [Marinactinospora thermotolerans DSM 45154]